MSAAPDNMVVEAVGLSKVFKDFWGRPKAAAVTDVNFQIKPGQVIGFLGPNGSGKSTTIKMMLGLLNPTSGSLKVFGRSPSNVQAKLKIGYLPEETYLYRYLTAKETIDFFGALFNLSPQERERRTKQLLDMVGLAHAADRPVGEFSKGMARRIGIAQALINDPDLIILDEPTSGLDPIGCRKVKEIIKLLAGRKKTVILCSHLLADVEDICDNVLIMYGGRIRAKGTMDELLTVEEKTRIVAPRLTPDVLEQIMAILNDAGPAEVDHPKMHLEDLFLDVVKRARQESVSTAGATDEGTIASYLSGDQQQPQDVLKNLAAEEEPLPPPPQEQQEEEPPAPKADVSKLQALSKDEEEPESPPAPEPSAEKPAPEKPKLSEEEKKAANQKIEDLLNKKK